MLLGNGAGGFGPKTDFPVTGLVLWVVAGDFSEDGKLDVAATNNDANTVSVLLGNGDGTSVRRRITRPGYPRTTPRSRT